MFLSQQSIASGGFCPPASLFVGNEVLLLARIMWMLIQLVYQSITKVNGDYYLLESSAFHFNFCLIQSVPVPSVAPQKTSFL